VLLDLGRLGPRLLVAVHHDKRMASLDSIRWSDFGETLVSAPSWVTMTTGFTDEYPHGAGLGESEGGVSLEFDFAATEGSSVSEAIYDRNDGFQTLKVGCSLIHVDSADR